MSMGIMKDFAVPVTSVTVWWISLYFCLVSAYKGQKNHFLVFKS